MIEICLVFRRPSVLIFVPYKVDYPWNTVIYQIILLHIFDNESLLEIKEKFLSFNVYEKNNFQRCNEKYDENGTKSMRLSMLR